MSDPGLEALNAAPESAAREQLLNCCGSRRWAEAMVHARPFRDRPALFEAATRLWNGLGEQDWLEAFSHHPRIGDRQLTNAGAGTRAWAKNEQAGMASADDRLQQAMRDGNRAYEEKFGRVYLVCATGKSADELLRILQSRLDNDAATELKLAAAEQDKITRLRLEKLLTP